MTNTIAGRALEHDRVFEFALLLRSLEDDFVDPVANPHYLSAEISLRRRKQKLLVLSLCIESLFDLRQALYFDQVACLQAEWMIAVPIAGPGDVPPAMEFADVRYLVINGNHHALQPLPDWHSIAAQVPDVLLWFPPRQRRRGINNFA